MHLLPLLKKVALTLTCIVLIIYSLGFLLKATRFSLLVPHDAPRTGPAAGARRPDPVFHKVGETRALAFSAHFDDRDEGRPFLRVFALAPRADGYGQISCQLLYGQSPAVVNVSAREHFINNHFGYPYGVYNFLCDLPERTPYPGHVTLTDGTPGSTESFWLPVPSIPGDGSPRHKFSVCLPTLFGEFNNSLVLVQHLEMNRILGAELVTVYNTSVSPYVDDVLRHYVNSGFVEVLQWPVHKFLVPSVGWQPSVDPGDLHYYGQIATINDCLYRNLHRTKYVVFTDADEFLLPRAWTNWGDMMSSIDDGGVAAFYFTLHTFAVMDQVTWRSPLGGGEAHGTNILNQTAKQISRDYGYDASTKIFGLPKKLIHNSVNTVLSHRPGTRIISVPNEQGSLQHYKRWKKDWGRPAISDLVADTHVQEFYGEMLTRRVLKKLDEIRRSSGDT